jgi:hypothetical protein
MSSKMNSEDKYILSEFKDSDMYGIDFKAYALVFKFIPVSSLPENIEYHFQEKEKD